MNSFNADTIEAVARVLYRQHRARNGFPEAVFGEWDNAGSHQKRFLADAREVLSALPLEPAVRSITPETGAVMSKFLTDARQRVEERIQRDITS